VFNSETDAWVNGTVIGCVSRHRNFTDSECFSRPDLNNVNSEWTIGAQVVVVGVAISLIEREHGEHRVNDLTGSDWSDNFQWNIDGHHDPTRRDQVIEISDVIAMKVRDQNGADHAGQNARAEQPHDGGTTAVDHDVLLARLYQGARTPTIGVRDRTASTEKSDFHQSSMSHK
jgi:hypothetical protein